MTRNALTDGLRNALISFLLLIPYNYAAFAVMMLVGEGGFTPWIAVPAAMVGLGALFLCGRYFLRELPSAIGTLLSLSALPLLYTGLAALICGKNFWYGFYPSFFLSSAALPISVFLKYDTPSALEFLSYALGILLPFAALYGGTLFQPIQKQVTAATTSRNFLKNSAAAFGSWLIAEAVCGVLYLFGIYELVAQGGTAERILGLLFAAVLALAPYIVPLIFGKSFGKRTKNTVTDFFSCCIPFLILMVARGLVTLFIAENPNVYEPDVLLYFRIPPTTMCFIYFIVPFLPGSEVVGGTMQSVIPDVVYGILPGVLPPIAYFIGMLIQKKRRKGCDSDA